MSYLNFTRPETLPSTGLTIYRGAMSPGLCEDISAEAAGLVTDQIDAVMKEGRGMRRFRASSIEKLGMLPLLNNVTEQTYADLFDTVKINVQGMCGRQAWHTDYIPEPVVLYPEGEGYLDFSPDAQNIQEARETALSTGLISVPIQAGDVALLERGGEIYHRGRNASEDNHRLTIVLH